MSLPRKTSCRYAALFSIPRWLASVRQTSRVILPAIIIRGESSSSNVMILAHHHSHDSESAISYQSQVLNEGRKRGLIVSHVKLDSAARRHGTRRADGMTLDKASRVVGKYSPFSFTSYLHDEAAAAAAAAAAMQRDFPTCGFALTLPV